jgi:glycosyltransferase involved in cell wall biosynthesis
VVGHPAVVSVNQEVYRELLAGGRWEVEIVLPRSWKHSYSDGAVAPEVLPGMERALRPTPVAFAGRQQRHLYLTLPGRRIEEFGPDVVFLEAEPFSLAAIEWWRPLRRRRVPFGVQFAENIDRSMPRPLVELRKRVLRDAAFVAARSETATRLAREWGAVGEVGIAPHAVPGWELAPAAGERPFSVGYAGRLVESKGLLDLLAAVRTLPAPLELILIGNGELRSRLEGEAIPGSRVRVIDDIPHEEMARGYGLLDVLVLPSHTTPSWKEQFGRVIVEALWCGVPVVGSSSGEIPWLIEKTGGGLVFPEGDAAALAERLTRLRDDPGLRLELAGRGRHTVAETFSVPAAAKALERLLIGACEG